MRLTHLRAALLALLTILTLFAATAPGASAKANTVHHGRYWAWTGPSNWIGTYGAYGIRVNSPSNQDVLDFGFSSTVCTPGATFAQSSANFFAQKRTQFNQGAFRIETVGPIVHPAGTAGTYRRQTLTLRIASGGVAYRGLFSFDYDYQTTVSTGFSTVNYCYQESIARYSTVARWPSIGRTIESVRKSLAYSGPGLPVHKPLV